MRMKEIYIIYYSCHWWSINPSNEWQLAQKSWGFHCFLPVSCGYAPIPLSAVPRCNDRSKNKPRLRSVYPQGWLGRHVAWISSPHLSKCPNGTYIDLATKNRRLNLLKFQVLFEWIVLSFATKNQPPRVFYHHCGDFPLNNRFMQPRNPTNNQVCLRRKPNTESSTKKLQSS